MEQQYYVGLMSGTSMDGLDITAVQFIDTPPFVDYFASQTYQFSHPLLTRMRALAGDCNTPYAELLALDYLLGQFSADCLQDFCCQKKLPPRAIAAVGLHGQTVRHNPHQPTPYSCQITNPSLIAESLGCVVVHHFRNADIAAGGQGAPLVCAFQSWLAERHQRPLLLLNIGGISNITLIDDAGVIGYDIGPGNCLLDSYSLAVRQKTFDNDGRWARSGVFDETLLTCLLQDDYFKRQPPKSIGVEYFTVDWLFDKLAVAQRQSLAEQDIQATITELNACLIADALTKFTAAATIPLYIFGGGAHNSYLQERIKARIDRPLIKSDFLGIDVDFFEATAFAWLARQRLNGCVGNIPSVTGAIGARVLGAVTKATLS